MNIGFLGNNLVRSEVNLGLRTVARFIDSKIPNDGLIGSCYVASAAMSKLLDESYISLSKLELTKVNVVISPMILP